MGGSDTDMTLVFALAALRRLVDPAAVLDDADGWTEYVGVVSDDEAELATFAGRDDVAPDFVAEATGAAGGLVAGRRQFRTARHVFVGASDADRDLARSHGWEYLDVEEAAAEADWPLAGDSP